MIRTSQALTIAPVSREILVAAATLRATSALKLSDAIHAATSLAYPCTTHLTNDHQLATISALPVLLLNNLA